MSAGSCAEAETAPVSGEYKSMPRTPSKVTQADVARVLRAVEQTGLPMDVIIEPDGRIRIVPHQEAETPQKSDTVDFVAEIRL